MKIVDLTIDEEGSGVYAISFVENPAIQKEWVALSAEEVKLQSLDNDRQIVYGAALIPNKPIYRVDAEGMPYYIRFSKEVIEQSAHNFIREGKNHNVTLEHSDKVDGVVFVESWIKEGDNDKSVHLGIDAPVGTWFVGARVDNAELWPKGKAGEVKGFSIEGLYSQVLSRELELSSIAKELEEIERLLNSHS